jgi:hypothetical protein
MLNGSLDTFLEADRRAAAKGPWSEERFAEVLRLADEVGLTFEPWQLRTLRTLVGLDVHDLANVVDVMLKGRRPVADVAAAVNDGPPRTRQHAAGDEAAAAAGPDLAGLVEPGVVVRPGDHLVFKASPRLTHLQAAFIRDEIRARLLGADDVEVTIVPPGVDLAAVIRRTADHAQASIDRDMAASAVLRAAEAERRFEREEAEERATDGSVADRVVRGLAAARRVRRDAVDHLADIEAARG